MSVIHTTPMSDALAAADDYLASMWPHGFSEPGDTVERCGLPGVLTGSPAAKRLYELMTPDNMPAVYRRLAEGLTRVPDPYVAGVLAVQLGTWVERGLDPAVLGAAMVERLSADFAAARRFVELLESEHHIARPADAPVAIRVAVARREPIGASAWAALGQATPAAMAAWRRHTSSRLLAAQAPRLGDDAAFLGDHGGYCHFIGELLQAADGELIVLAPDQHKGFVVEMTCVRNAAHLFVLLEDALVGPSEGRLLGPRADPEIAAIARGEAMLECDRWFSIGWHYEYWFGIRPGSAATARLTGLHPEIAAMIGVEASARHLATIRGQAVVLMGPGKFSSRACDAKFIAPLHAAQRSGVSMRRRLAPDEVDTWLRDLQTELDALERPTR